MIDLDDARNVLLSAEKLLEALNGQDIEDNRAERGQGYSARRKMAAEASKDLLQLADHLALAETLVRRAYWMMKGNADPMASFDSVEASDVFHAG